jgi:hypothetical protein
LHPIPSTAPIPVAIFAPGVIRTASPSPCLSVHYACHLRLARHAWPPGRCASSRPRFRPSPRQSPPVPAKPLMRHQSIMGVVGRSNGLPGQRLLIQLLPYATGFSPPDQGPFFACIL